MSDAFDAYHKWLGIPPSEQPPNHYRLLGIQVFESDSEVIRNAADRCMTHLKSFSSGPHAHLSQKLLNEVSAARVCLLSEQKKYVYDTGLELLRRIEEEDARALSDPASSSPTFPVIQTDLPPVGPNVRVSSARLRNKRRKRRRRRLVAGLVATIGCAILLIAMFFVFLSIIRPLSPDRESTVPEHVPLTQTLFGRASPTYGSVLCASLRRGSALPVAQALSVLPRRTDLDDETLDKSHAERIWL